MQPEDSKVGPMKDSDIIYTLSFLKGTIMLQAPDEY